MIFLSIFKNNTDDYMGIIAEILFSIFQTPLIWGKQERSYSSKFAAVALIAVILVVVILIWQFNPLTEHQIDGDYSSVTQQEAV